MIKKLKISKYSQTESEGNRTKATHDSGHGDRTETVSYLTWIVLQYYTVEVHCSALVNRAHLSHYFKMTHSTRTNRI